MGEEYKIIEINRRTNDSELTNSEKALVRATPPVPPREKAFGEGRDKTTPPPPPREKSNQDK